MKKSINSDLWLYSLLDRFSLRESFARKVMFVTFLGIHLPAMGIITYLTMAKSWNTEANLKIILICLFGTISSSVITLSALGYLLTPVNLTYQAVKDYLRFGKIPTLPTKFTDEVGTLMANTTLYIKRLDKLLEHFNNYDGLTQLPKAKLHRDRLKVAMQKTQESHKLLGIINIKLNNLKQINQTLGEKISDQLLIEAARIISLFTAENDLVARIKTKEFAIGQVEVNTTEEIFTLCESLLKSFNKPIVIDNTEIFFSISMGIAIYPYDGTSVDGLCHKAYTAMHTVKASQNNKYQFYDSENNEQFKERLTLEKELRYALEHNEFQLYYQPFLDLKTQKIIAVEALLRWQNPSRGLVLPGKFIPLAEATGLIIPLGLWVLRTACAQNKMWQNAGLPPIKISVNLSARQFQQPNLVAEISQILQETQLESQYLQLEITESLMMQNLQLCSYNLEKLRYMGISIALDDFGTGYSSLSCLKTLPIHGIKIDRSFIRDLGVNEVDLAIISAIITLAKSLKLKITAEGVENKEQLEYLKKQKCDQIQGYYFSLPLPVLKFTELLVSSAKNSTSSQEFLHFGV